MGDLTPIKGTLDVLVLKALSQTAMHGFEIATWIEDRSGGALGVEDSALYQALYRLEERGHVDARWGVTSNSRRARYYTLTRRGRTHLKAEAERLTRYSSLLVAILGSQPVAEEGK